MLMQILLDRFLPVLAPLVFHKSKAILPILAFLHGHIVQGSVFLESLSQVLLQVGLDCLLLLIPLLSHPDWSQTACASPASPWTWICLCFDSLSHLNSSPLLNIIQIYQNYHNSNKTTTFTKGLGLGQTVILPVKNKENQQQQQQRCTIISLQQHQP